MEYLAGLVKGFKINKGDKISNPRPRWETINWKPSTEPGFDKNNPGMNIKSAKEHQTYENKVKEKFAKLHPLHRDRGHQSELYEKALHLLSKSFPSNDLFQDDHHRIGYVASVEDFASEDERIGLTKDIQRYGLLSIDVEDRAEPGDCREAIYVSSEVGYAKEPFHRFYFRRCQYVLVSNLAGAVMVFDMPQLIGSDIDGVIRTWRPVKYLIDYLPPIVKELLESPEVINIGSAIVEEEFEKRFAAPHFIPLRNVDTQRLFQWWHDNGWSPKYEAPNEGGFGMEAALLHILDFEVPLPGPLFKGVLYQWLKINSTINDFFKRHRYKETYSYMLADIRGAPAIGLVVLLKVLGQAESKMYDGNAMEVNGDYLMKVEQSKDIRSALFELFIPSFRYAQGQGPAAENIIARREIRASDADDVLDCHQRVKASRKRKHEEEEWAVNAKRSKRSGTHSCMVSQGTKRRVIRDKCLENKPLQVKTISYSKGVTIGRNTRSRKIKFIYDVEYAYQEANKNSPTLPHTCSLCNKEDHQPVRCPVAQRMERIAKKSKEQDKLPPEHFPRRLRRCTYPWCDDPLSHLKSTCPVMHHRCEKCDLMGHLESWCEYKDSIEQMYGDFQGHASDGVLTRFIREASVKNKRKCASKGLPPPPLPILEIGFFRPPVILRGIQVRSKLKFEMSELRYIDIETQQPVIYRYPCFAFMSDKKKRLAAIKKIPHYLMKSAADWKRIAQSKGDERDHADTDEEVTPNPSLESKLSKENEELKQRIQELQNRLNKSEKARARLADDLLEYEAVKLLE